MDPADVLPTSSPQHDARGALLALINANWTTQALATASRLGLPQRLADGPRSAVELALAVQCHAPSLARLLRALTSIGVLAETADGRFALTPTGTLLRSDVDGSLAAWAELCGTSSWVTWGHLLDSVRSGESRRKRASGVDGFDHLARDADEARRFHRAMVALTRPVAESLAQRVDFSGMGLVVDVGGGQGELLATLLAAQPWLRGIVFDLAHASDAADERLADLAGRCSFVAGSFFEAVPPHADGYLLKSILHDWDDEAALRILCTCRRAMAPHARLFIIERAMPERLSPSPQDQGIARSDLNMLVSTGGRERTQTEYLALLAAADLRLAGMQPLAEPYGLLEAAPA
jgi:hypothetical protein